MSRLITQKHTCGYAGKFYLAYHQNTHDKWQMLQVFHIKTIVFEVLGGVYVDKQAIKSIDFIII